MGMCTPSKNAFTVKKLNKIFWNPPNLGFMAFKTWQSKNWNLKATLYFLSFAEWVDHFYMDGKDSNLIIAYVNKCIYMH